MRKHRRQVKIYGINKPVEVEITNDGLSFWVKGSRKRLILTWFSAVNASITPESVPSYLKDKPLEFLTKMAT